MPGVIVNSPKQQFFNSNGLPLSGGKIQVYLAGTTTPSPTWKDQLQTTLNTNPILLDSRGEAVIWLQPGTIYDFVLMNPDNSVIYTVGNVGGNSSAQAAALVNTGFKNRLINGTMMLNQRVQGTTGTDQTYCADRWRLRGVIASGTIACGQVSGFPSTSIQGTFAWLFSTTVNGTVNSTSVVCAEQFIEGFNVQDFKLGTANAASFTLQFYASVTSGTFVMGISFSNNALNRSYVTSVTLTTTPTLYSITVPGDTAGTWAIDKTCGLTVRFAYALGSTFTTATTGAWQAGDLRGPLAQGNGLTTASAQSVYLSDVQLEKGTLATQYDLRSWGTELALAQRYYEKSYDYATNPSTATGVGAQIFVMPVTSAANVVGLQPVFKVAKRTTPTIKYWSIDGTADTIRDVAAATNRAATYSSQGEGTGLAATATWGVAASINAQAQWVANADF